MIFSYDIGLRKMKGIVLAGGFGTRLHPITKGVSKQLLPIYDKPMVYYPISILMLSGIKDILIITNPEDYDSFRRLLGSGDELGVCFKYKIQNNPDGIAQAFILGEDFINGDDVCLILGDNIFYGHDLISLLNRSVDNAKKKKNATVFGYHVNDPERYGIVEFDKNKKVVSIDEKPLTPRSNYALTGLYFYPNDVIQKSKKINPSARGELEITDLNCAYLSEDRLNVEIMGRGFAWLDTGTHESLHEASAFVETLEKRQGLKISCIEEIAYDKGYISKESLKSIAENYSDSSYGEYLKKIVCRT